MTVARGGPPIYVDFDDVLCDTARTAAEVAADRFGCRTPFEDIRFFDLGRSFGIARDQVDELMDALHEPGAILSLPPLPGASEVLARWSAQGHAIHIVTGRPASTEAASRQWLHRHGVPFAELLFADKYNRDRPDARRFTWSLSDLVRMQFRLVIEDSPEMATILGRRTPVGLLDRPWNRALPPLPAGSPAVVRCSGWDEIGERFTGWLGGCRSSDGEGPSVGCDAGDTARDTPGRARPGTVPTAAPGFA